MSPSTAEDRGSWAGRNRGRLVLLLAVAVAGVAATSTVPAGAAAVGPRQRLVRLLAAHEAFARPSRQSTPLHLVSGRRPLTGERTELPVLGQTKHWLLVGLPGRPNGGKGWIARWRTRISTTPWHIVVETASRRVVVYRDGRPRRTFRAIVGKPSTPTPLGQFFVEESIALRPADVGAPFALALSARSSVLRRFDGGPGQIGLHGLDNIGGVLGTAVSHGCVRLADRAMAWLVRRIGPGVPVTIIR
jgi:lipoprotein-anchoring transpeptidase ErfK/SrfK